MFVGEGSTLVATRKPQLALTVGSDLAAAERSAMGTYH
jgi:hypothetical protein